MERILIDEETLQQRIRELADEITEDYNGQPITIIGILKGSIYFLTDLSRRLKLPTRIEFMRLQSYEGEHSTGRVNIKMDLEKSIKGHDVLVIEDIVDTGRTLDYLLQYLALSEPRSLKLCALLDKPERREFKNINADYVGFRIKNRFVVGYGLDKDEEYRNLPDIRCFVADDEDISDDLAEIQKQLKKKRD